MPFVNISGPIVANTVYASNKLVARDVAVTLPEVAPTTADVSAMGTLTLPIWQLMDNMELSITKIGQDSGLINLIKPASIAIELRWVQTSTDANGTTKNVGCKAFIKCIPNKIPSADLAVGEASELECTASVTRYQVFVDGKELFLIDRLSGIVRIGGTDYSKGVNNML